MIDPQTSDPAAGKPRGRGPEREREADGAAERRGNLAIAIAAVVALVYMGSAFYLMASKPSDPLSQSLLSNGKVVFGVPAAGIGAFLVLLIWSQTVGGNIRFKFMGFEFYGASAPAILWVVVFLSIILAIKLL